MELIANSIIPVFILVALGYWFKRAKFIEDVTEKFLNNLAYYLVLPAMVFASIYKSPFEKIFSLKMIAGLYLAAFAVFVLAAAAASFYPKEKRGSFVLPSFRTNIAYIGFPIILHAYGQLALAEIGVITGFMAPFMIILSIIYLNIMNKDNGTHKASILYYIISDPLVISSIVGLVFSYFKIGLPVFLSNTVEMVSSMGSPLMLIAVGAGLKISTIKKDRWHVILATSLKLFIQPLFAWLIFTFFIILPSPLDFKVAVMTFTFPSALSTYIMVKQYKGDGELTAAIIMVTTLLSILTMSGWILFLGK